MSRQGPRLTRRQLLVYAAALGASACVPSDRGAAREPTPTPTPEPDPTPPSPAPEPPPAPEPEPPEPEPEPGPEPEPVPDPEPLEPAEPWEPLDEEPYPNFKRLGAQVAQALCTYEAGQSLEEVVEGLDLPRSDDLDLDEVLAKAEPLHREGAQSTGEVVYVQFGGLDPMWNALHGSAIVVIRQRVLVGRIPEEYVRAIDVRLALDEERDEWQFDALGDAGGEPTARPANLSDAANAVLEDERIDLPDSSRWDIYRGAVMEELLDAMLDLADLFPYRVSCLVSGHPVHVFGTENVSDHTVGRAVDIWAVDGEPVILQQPDEDTPTYEMTEAAFDDRIVDNIGAPWALDDVGGRSFTDPVHLDHLHLAVRPGRPELD